MADSNKNWLTGFCVMLGWQGGTVHQVADEIGVSVGDLLSGAPDRGVYLAGDYSLGFSACGTCSREWVRTKLLPQYKGNKDFWLGYKRRLELGNDN